MWKIGLFCILRSQKSALLPLATPVTSIASSKYYFTMNSVGKCLGPVGFQNIAIWFCFVFSYFYLNISILNCEMWPPCKMRFFIEITFFHEKCLICYIWHNLKWINHYFEKKSIIPFYLELFPFFTYH